MNAHMLATMIDEHNWRHHRIHGAKWIKSLEINEHTKRKHMVD